MTGSYVDEVGSNESVEVAGLLEEVGKCPGVKRDPIATWVKDGAPMCISHERLFAVAYNEGGTVTDDMIHVSSHIITRPT